MINPFNNFGGGNMTGFPQSNGFANGPNFGGNGGFANPGFGMNPGFGNTGDLSSLLPGMGMGAMPGGVNSLGGMQNSLMQMMQMLMALMSGQGMPTDALMSGMDPMFGGGADPLNSGMQNFLGGGSPAMDGGGGGYGGGSGGGGGGYGGGGSVGSSGGGGGGGGSVGGGGGVSGSADPGLTTGEATPGAFAMLKDAGSMVGLQENRDRNAIMKVTGKSGIDPASTPWCAAFAMNMIKDHGLLDLDGLSNRNYCPTIESWARGKGIYGTSDKYKPKSGDAILFDWEAKGGTPDHIGLVEKIKDGKVYTIEGNSSDSVKRNVYSLNDPRIDGYVVTKDKKKAAAPATKPPTAKATPATPAKPPATTPKTTKPKTVTV